MAIRCDCGHSLRTVEERNDGQCIRCSGKNALSTDSVKWQAMGSAAYDNGQARSPIMDNDVAAEIRNGCDFTDICREWLHGWDSANILDNDW